MLNGGTRGMDETPRAPTGTAIPPEGRRRVSGWAVAAVAASIAYVAAAASAFDSSTSYHATIPPFAVMSPEESNQIVPPISPTMVVYRPVAFDPVRQTLTLRMFVRPDGTSGGLVVGDNWQFDGSDVRLIFNGPLEIAGNRGDPDLIFEGDPSVLPNNLLEAIEGDPTVSGDLRQLIESSRASEWADATQYSPFDIDLPTQLYGRAFRFRDDAFWFPFDSYGFQMSIHGNVRYHFAFDPIRMLEEPSQWFPLPLEPFPGRGNEISGRGPWSTLVDGWEVSYRHTGWLVSDFPTAPEAISESMQLGLIGVSFYVERPRSEVLLTGLFALIFLVTIFALVIVVRSVRGGRRPPTGFGLVWAAALAFAAVSLRTALPSEVPYGVAFDWLFFFPTLLGSALFTLMLATDWVSRDDFTP